VNKFAEKGAALACGWVEKFSVNYCSSKSPELKTSH